MYCILSRIFYTNSDQFSYMKYKNRSLKHSCCFSGFQNVAHMGPPCSGKPLENFVILLNDENAVCVMNTSAQFCKMSVDYFFEKPSGTSNDFIVTLFIEGQPVADAKAPKKMLKQIVTERALQCLDMFCHIVVTNKELIQNCTTVSRLGFFIDNVFLL